jgi:hypothetical protein
MKPPNSQRVEIARPPRRQEMLHRQKEIVGAAFDIFAAHGYKATSIMDRKNDRRNDLTRHSIAAMLLFS